MGARRIYLLFVIWTYSPHFTATTLPHFSTIPATSPTCQPGEVDPRLLQCADSAGGRSCSESAYSVGLMRLRGGDTLVNPVHERRLAAKDAERKEKNRGRVLTIEERKKESQRPERTLLVRNLCEAVDETRLLYVFILGGDVVKVTMPRDPETERHYGYAYVEFRRTFYAACALYKFNFVKLYDKPMKITHLIRGKAAEEYYHPCAKLFVSRLAPEVTEWDLWWAFQVLIRAFILITVLWMYYHIQEANPMWRCLQ